MIHILVQGEEDEARRKLGLSSKFMAEVKLKTRDSLFYT